MDFWGSEKFHKSSALIKFGVKHSTAQVNPWAALHVTNGYFLCGQAMLLPDDVTSANEAWKLFKSIPKQFNNNINLQGS